MQLRSHIYHRPGPALTMPTRGCRGLTRPVFLSFLGELNSVVFAPIWASGVQLESWQHPPGLRGGPGPSTPTCHAAKQLFGLITPVGHGGARRPPPPHVPRLYLHQLPAAGCWAAPRVGSWRQCRIYNFRCFVSWSHAVLLVGLLEGQCFLGQI